MHTKQKLKLGISACLLGQKVRYDGGHKLDWYVTSLIEQKTSIAAYD